MTIVIDTKNEMKRSIDGLGSRVNDLERDLRAAFVAEITGLRESALTDLKSSQQETRTSAYNAGKRASEAVAAVADLRRDVDRLHHGLDGLREDVGQILEALQAQAQVAVQVTAVGAGEDPYPAAVPDAAGTGYGPEVVALPGQRPAPVQESASRAEPSVSGPVDSPPAAAGREASAAPDTPVSDESETELPAPEVDQAPEGDDRGHQKDENDQDVPRAALEASEQGRGESVNEPSPLTWEGRIWAIMRAGKVASATLVCHRDTWEFVAAQVGSHPHFRTPTLEERENGLVAAVLSGRSMVAMLLALYRVAIASRRRPDGEDLEELVAYADWAMASQVYYATARVLSTAWSGEGDSVIITIDNRVPARA
ncbi:hypothetical protein [Streptomyces sp. D54]|uniref:hypothetical protein n=1 Tax=Streptomyces sp. D54 TaxID=1290289 RepID=UPI003CF303AA